MLTPQERETTSETKLFVFNPEHDLALAVGLNPYTPPAEALKVRKSLSLLPAVFAGDGDFILLQDDFSELSLSSLPYFDIASLKHLQVIRLNQLPEFVCQIGKIIPWGWDFPLKRTLLEHGTPPSLLPADEEILRIRELSHRRLTIPFRKHIAAYLDTPLINLAEEICNIEGVSDFLLRHPAAYFKAPWSSSGHGIVVSDHISQKGLFEWARGILRRQGSIIAEPAWNRVFDFASEWIIADGEPRLIGFSVFSTSSRGKYHGNMEASQPALLAKIREKCPGFSMAVTEAQKSALQKFVAPFYSGPAGIDMLADASGNINPCVEINLRLTMGHLVCFKSENKLSL